jgi:hypothetical protein
MGPHYVYLYLTAMREEAMTATFAYERIDKLRSRLRELHQSTDHLFTDDGDEDAEMFNALGNKDFLAIPDVEEDLATAIEAFLSAQARLSLFLSPSPVAKEATRAQSRAAVLRQQLEFKPADDLGDRGLRNAWMHVDESIDAFVFERADAANLIARHVGAAERERRRILRLIDPSRLTVCMLGKEYPLPEIYDWINDVDRRLGVALQKLERELNTPER